MVVTVGDTLTGVPISPPGFHVYDVAPKLLNVAVLPTHIAVLLKEAVTVGFAITNKFRVFVAIHPNAVVPEIVYVVVTVGDTVTGEPTINPGFQVYVAAPTPVKVALVPTQIEGDDAVAVIVGLDTVKVKVVVFVQPNPLDPVTV